jgi:hypothetical protein
LELPGKYFTPELITPVACTDKSAIRHHPRARYDDCIPFRLTDGLHIPCGIGPGNEKIGLCNVLLRRNIALADEKGVRHRIACGQPFDLTYTRLTVSMLLRQTIADLIHQYQQKKRQVTHHTYQATLRLHPCPAILA